MLLARAEAAVAAVCLTDRTAGAHRASGTLPSKWQPCSFAFVVTDPELAFHNISGLIICKNRVRENPDAVFRPFPFILSPALPRVKDCSSARQAIVPARVEARPVSSSTNTMVEPSSCTSALYASNPSSCPAYNRFRRKIHPAEIAPPAIYPRAAASAAPAIALPSVFTVQATAHCAPRPRR